MKVVILCGGQGTRIREVSEVLPKPMIPIGRFPILWHIMKNFAQAGHKDFILCLGYKGESIREFFLNYNALTRDSTITLGDNASVAYHDAGDNADWRISLAETGLESLTATRIRMVKKYLGDDDDFIVTYGDGVGDIDYSRLIEFHRSHGKVLTVTGVHPPARFGEMELTSEGMVTEFNEKTQVARGWISGGFLVANKRIFDYISSNADQMVEEQPMTAMVKAQQVMAYQHEGFWHPMDTPRDYRLLNSLWSEGNAPWKTW
jgi:glucose-1-phosphate cytidylyltransferase